MRCGKCNEVMKEKEEDLFGEKIRVFVCPKCRNELLLLKEAIRVQEKIIPRVETTRKLVKFGHSIAVTLPRELHTVFKKGEEVRVSFDPHEMELTVRKK